MIVKTAREWLDSADWSASQRAREAMVERVGSDKADEFIATMDRIAANLLYTLDTLKMSERTMSSFILFASSVTLDNTLPHERGTG